MKHLLTIALTLVCYKNICLLDGKMVKTQKPTKEQKLLIEKHIYDQKVKKIKGKK